MASMAKRIVIICRHDKRRFVEKLQYVTTPGYLDGPGARERAGLPGGGPVRVITDRAILGFDEKTKRMRLEAIYPGGSVEDVVANTGFDLLFAPRLEQVPAPTPDQLRLLRRVIDPTGIYIGKSDS
jgi:glutaconate CoA-transferase subunit B